MNNREAGEARPPRWAQAVLHCVVRARDRESIAGDLLEEYRAAREPALGRLRANLWYVEQVSSILWRVIWPGALAMAAQSVFLALTVFRPGHHAPHQSPLPLLTSDVFEFLWYGSVAPAPGVSIVDAAIYFIAAYVATRRTNLVRTGILVAALTTLAGSCVLFAAAVLITPGLAQALFAQPALFVILAVYVAIPLVYGTLIGALGGIAGRLIGPRANQPVRAA